MYFLFINTLERDFLVCSAVHSLLFFPDSISQVIIVKEQCTGIIITVKAFIELALGCSHRSQLLNLRNSLFWIKSCEVNSSKLSFKTVHATIKLVVVVHVIVEAINTATVYHWILLLILIHEF